MACIIPYDDILAALDADIVRLIQARNTIAAKQAHITEINNMRERGGTMSDLLIKASTFADPGEAHLYINTYILPLKDYLPQEYFPKTLSALPESLPSKWNDFEVSIFFLEVSGALEQDRAVLASLHE